MPPISGPDGGGGGGAAPPAPSGDAQTLESRSALPGIVGYSPGDIIDVEGILHELVADADAANLVSGISALHDTSYYGDSTFAWQVQAPYNMRANFSRGGIGAAPPAVIYATYRHSDGETSEIVLARASGGDTATTYRYVHQPGSPALDSGAGTYSLELYSDAARTTALDVHGSDRWEVHDRLRTAQVQAIVAQMFPAAAAVGIQITYDAATGKFALAVPSTSPTRAQVYALAKLILRAGAGVTLTPDDDDDEIEIAAVSTSQQVELLRPATWARAWIRAATESAALAGVAAATWTDDGPGTPPTGAYWDLSQVPAGAGNLYEIVSMASARQGAWTLGTWSAIGISAANTQYSVDGASAWHAVRVAQDRYERHRDALGAWSAAIPLYAADELVWTTIVSTIIQSVSSHDPGVLIELPAPILTSRLDLMRIRLRTETSGAQPILEDDKVIRPDMVTAIAYAQRAQATDSLETLIVTLEARGLAVVGGQFGLGTGPANAGGAAGLKLRFVRPAPPAVVAAQDCAYLQCYWVKNLQTRHVLQIDVM